MNTRKTNSGFGIEGRIDTKVHSVDDLRARADNYDSLSKREKLELARKVSPVYENVTYNVTTDELHKYFVDNLDPAQTAAKDNVSISHMALGDDGASGSQTSDTDLNNRVYSEAVSDVADNSKDILASTFVDSTEANGNMVDEIGLYTGDPSNLGDADVFLMNHATFNAITKDNSKTVTFDVTLQFADA